MRYLVTLVALLGACAAPAPTTAPAAPTKPAAPAAATAPQRVALVNPGFESTAPSRRDAPEGWFTFQHAGDPSYRFALDTDNPHGGARSLRIDNIGPEPYGAIAQSLQAKPHAGKVARLTGWVRTRDVSGTGAAITLLALAGGASLAHNSMDDAPIKGTTGWTRYTITLPVPPSADRIEVGATLQGKGSLWLDDVELDFVPR